MKHLNSKVRTEMDKIDIPQVLSERTKMGIARAKSEIGQPIKRKWYVLAGPALAAAIALSIVGPGLLSDNPPENPVIKFVQYSSVFDVSDTRRLVGWSDSVFIGKVIQQTGSKSMDGIPETQFKVEVSDLIKGDLKGSVTVNQQGGFKGKELILVEKDKLLVEGNSYLFVTKHLQEENWHTLVPVYGDIQITSDEHKQELIAKFEKAYEEEIPFDVNNP
jgi:hypothetical protein